VLPALGMLDEVSLWNQTVTVGGEDRIEPITLAAVILAAVVGIVTAVAARNLPGVLEIAFLQRLNIEPGTRYAAATLSRYFIVAVGTVLVFQNLGASWSSIQWLVAALGVGLGFGLQEIFGNFVSGMIILFERPIRVGDTVTVADLSGTVSRIRIRATTITDWDRKEIVVPNKSFITERVVNWTLSDPITRQVIPVGVAYGSDTALAHRVMLETVRGLPLVLDEPEPRVFFDGFGESSLDFKLYVYARQLADRLPLRHEVHMAVNRALAENGIQIPFPQRDIHVRSTPASRGRGGKQGGAGGD
jgi:potassium efflux system protein